MTIARKLGHPVCVFVPRAIRCLYSGVGGEGEVDSNGWPVDSEPQGERDVESAVSRLQTAARAMLARRQFLRVSAHIPLS